MFWCTSEEPSHSQQRVLQSWWLDIPREKKRFLLMRSLIVALSHLPETKDAAAANGDARLANVADRLQSVFIGPVDGSQYLISPVVCNQCLLPVTEQAAILQRRSTNELQRPQHQRAAACTAVPKRTQEDGETIKGDCRGHCPHG